MRQFPRSLAVALVVVACGSTPEQTVQSIETSIVNSSPTSTTSTAISTTTTEDPNARCDAAIDSILETVDSIFDRIDADPLSFTDDDTQEATTDLFTDIGGVMATECTDIGSALSELVVYLTDQSSVRTTFTQAVIEGMLTGLCDPNLGFEFTLQGRGACAGTK